MPRSSKKQWSAQTSRVRTFGGHQGEARLQDCKASRHCRTARQQPAGLERTSRTAPQPEAQNSIRKNNGSRRHDVCSHLAAIEGARISSRSMSRQQPAGRDGRHIHSKQVAKRYDRASKAFEQPFTAVLCDSTSIQCKSQKGTIAKHSAGSINEIPKNE